ELDIRFTRSLTCGACPCLTAVRGIEELSAGQKSAMSLVGEIDRTLSGIFARKRHPGFPRVATILSSRYREARIPCTCIADSPTSALVQEEQFRKFAIEIAHQALYLYFHLALIDGLPLPASILSSQDSGAGSLKSGFG